MKLHELKPAEGSRKVRNRVGRGIGYVTVKLLVKVIRTKRTFGGVRLGFEGGQTPLFRRLPKRASQTLTVKSLLL